MHVTSGYIILFMLVLNMSCTGQQNTDWTIIFTPPGVTAVPGICALITCSFTYPDGAKPIATVRWYYNNKKEIYNKNKNDGQGRILMLEPDLDKNNCSIIIQDITTEDEGEYSFRVEGPWPYRSTYKPSVKITIQDKPVMDVPLLRDGQQTNLSCSAPFPCPESPPEITWWINKTGEVIEMKENITLTTNMGFYVSTLTFMPKSDLHKSTVVCLVSYGHTDMSDSRTIEVMYVENLRIVGNDTVSEGDTLSLSCTANSHPASSKPVWSFNGSTEKLRKHTSEETLTITNVSRQHAGEYSCTVTYMNEILNASINIKVIRPKGSENVEVENMTENKNETQTVPRNTTGGFLQNVELSTVLTFLAGMGTSAVIFSVLLCCWLYCRRAKKHKGLTAVQDTAINLQTVQTNVDLTPTNEQTPLHDQFNGAISNVQVESTGEAEEGNQGGAEAEEVDYAAIDYSLLKKKQLEQTEVEAKSGDTEYAEIRRDGKRPEGPQDETSNGGKEDQRQMEAEEEIYCNSEALKR